MVHTPRVNPPAIPPSMPPPCIICKSDPRLPGRDHHNQFHKCCEGHMCRTTGLYFKWCPKCKHKKVQRIESVPYMHLRCNTCETKRGVNRCTNGHHQRRENSSSQGHRGPPQGHRDPSQGHRGPPQGHSGLPQGHRGLP